MQDRRGHLWFATTGGISRYDGQVFQNTYRRDGLPHHEELTLTNFNLKDLIRSLGKIFEMRCDQKNLVWILEQIAAPT